MRADKENHGAKNGTRTRDPDHGKVVLYQLSYFRELRFIFQLPACHESR